MNYGALIPLGSSKLEQNQLQNPFVYYYILLISIDQKQVPKNQLSSETSER